MNYKVKEHDFAFMIFEDNQGHNWDYISVTKMEELYPNGGYYIIGDLKGTDGADFIGYLTKGDIKIKVFAYHPKISSNEKCIGFIPIYSEDNRDCYIRLIKRNSINLLLYLMIVMFIVSVIGLIIILNKKETAPKIDENAISYHVEGMENKNKNNTSIPIYSELKVNSKTMESKSLLSNPEGNPCYFRYHIRLKENKQEIYRSDLIKPGTAISEFKLNEKLKPGEYIVLLEIKAFALKDHKTPMNGGDMTVKLIVEENN